VTRPLEPGLTSVVVVTANSGALAVECVKCVLASSSPIELIVVDNDSQDGQIGEIGERFGGDGRLRIVRNPDNTGFGPACNRGAALARGDALLFLNPDCLIGVDTISALREAATRHAQAGLLGVRVVGAQGEVERANRRRDPTLWRSFNTLTGLQRFARRWPALAGVELEAAEAGGKAEPVDAVSGACLFLPRDSFDAVGGFDEAYFLHCEDLDLCRRVRDAGRSVLYLPAVTVRHEQGSSSFRRPLFVSRHKHRGMWRYFAKFDPAARNPFLRILVLCGIWTHFALLAPVHAWRQYRRDRR
jgi:N-acetylglucosaminyl-diphospho-decaprenol L-rhamnosyltransferase